MSDASIWFPGSDTLLEQLIVNTLSATSQSSVAIGAGTKAFIINESPRLVIPGCWMMIVDKLDTSNYMLGKVLSYNTDTNEIVFNVPGTAFSGVGVKVDWEITVSSAPGIAILSGELNVKTYGAIGDGVTDDTSAIQAVIDAASLAASSTQNRSIVTVVIPEGDFKITAQLVIKPHVNIRCEGILYNNLADNYTFCVWFKSGSHCEKIQVWGNGKNGVQFGVLAEYANMQIGDVRLWNIGEVYVNPAQYNRGVLITGYNFTIESIDCDGGNIGVDFNEASDVRLDKILGYSASTGCRITSACEHIFIGYMDIDTPAYMGLQVDSSKDINIPNAVVFINDQVGTGALTSGYAIKLGEFSGASKLTGFCMNLRAINTGGTGVYLANIRNSNVTVQVQNDALFTGGATPVLNGIEYGAGVEASLDLRGLINCATPIVGAPVGTLLLNMNGAYYNPNVQPIDATLTALAGLVTAADKLIYATGIDTFALTTLTAAGRALIDDADAATQRATLGLGNAAVATIGTAAGNVAPGDSVKLPAYTVAGVPAAGANTDKMIIVTNEVGGYTPAFSDGTNWRRVTDRAIIA